MWYTQKNQNYNKKTKKKNAFVGKKEKNIYKYQSNWHAKKAKKY